MTNEEAIEYNKNLREYMRITDTESEFKFLKENYEALDMGIKALEQEPCEDCISRAKAIEINKKYHGQMPNDINHQIWQELNDLPSVQPIRPKGEWEYINDGIFTKIKCECGYEQVVVDGFADNYCPNCGAEMTESDG